MSGERILADSNALIRMFSNEKAVVDFLEGADILQGPQNAIYTRTVTDPAWGARALCPRQ